MKFVSVVTAVAVALMLTGCAGSVSQPKALTAMSAEQQSSLHISGITADADDGVEMTSSDFKVITERVRSFIVSDSPGVMVDPATGDTLTMKIHFTRFDRGNAFARFMLIGLGQMHIYSVVTLVKADGKVAGEYKVRKTFALGGWVGAMTSMDEVEDGFARSVAEIVKKKASA